MSQLNRIVVLSTLCVFLGYAGTDDGIASLRPLAAADHPSVVFEPALLGKWTWGVEITSVGKNGYEVLLDTKCTMHLVKLGGILLADLGSPDDQGVPFHMFLKIRIEPDQLHVDSPAEWLAEQIKARGLPRHEVLTEGGHTDHVLLTASSEELRRDLLPLLNDPRAWQDLIDLQREGPERDARDLSEQSWKVVRGGP